MRSRKRWPWIPGAAVFGWMLMALPVAGWAVSFDHLTTPVAGGVRYDFTLDNDLGTDVFEVFVDLPVPVGDLSDFRSPGGWGDGLGKRHTFSKRKQSEAVTSV